MTSGIDVSAYLQKYMHDLISLYELTLVPINQREALLGAETYCIYVVAAREDVRFIYFDITTKPIKGYDIYFFLFNKRYSLLKSMEKPPLINSAEQYFETEIMCLVSHVREAGEDIMSGSKKWLAAYPWPTISPPKNLLFE